MSLRLHTTLALTLLGLACLVTPAHAQERAAGINPILTTTISGTLNDNTGQQAISAGLRAGVSTTAANMNEACSDGGNTYQHGNTWSTGCPNGSIGTVTKVCLHGRNAVQSDTCQSALPCGGHPSGTSWSGSCPSGTTGSMTYKCQDGNVVVDSSQAYSCRVSNCTNSNGTVACPGSTADGIPMTGSMSYSCSNDTLYFTANNCSTYNKPCGGIPHGGGSSVACTSVMGNAAGGNVYFYCNNGYNYVSGMDCYPKTWHSFNVRLAESCDYNGRYGADHNCTASIGDLQGEVRSLIASSTGASVPPGTPFTGVTARWRWANPSTGPFTVNLNDMNSTVNYNFPSQVAGSCGGHTGQISYTQYGSAHFTAGASNIVSGIYYGSSDCYGGGNYGGSVFNINIIGQAYY